MPENIYQSEYSALMQQSYLNYSMSVITSRAVPDVRDGLKPVQRRVLYAMNELGLSPDKPYKKCARIVGEAMGKYHPHGDGSIYDTLVVLSQDFKKGMALVDGHGNFGSIEGDGAAAMRYTEARLAKFTKDVYLADIDKDVVDFMPNFDETEKEPCVLPVRVPNILINGSEGIAVGMTTAIPPHNLGEVVDAMKYILDYPDASTEELMMFLKGPDFPTGGIITNKDELLSIYETGKGRIKLRGKAEVIRGKKRGEKDCIVITEIPYTMIGMNIGKFLSDVVDLAERKKLPDIVDVSNQSKDSIRIVIEIKKDADAERILQGLYKKTGLENTFGVNCLVIADGRPKTLGLRDILTECVKFQEELATRKYTSLLKKDREHLEIAEGLIHAVDIIDLIIEVIRGSENVKMAKECLTDGKIEGINFKTEKSRKEAKKLNFTPAQAQAILDLRLSKLIHLEILALQSDYDETLKRIKEYEDILGNKKSLVRAIKKDLDRIKKEYARPRRTLIENTAEAVFEEEPEAEYPVYITMNRFGYIKAVDENAFLKNEEAVRAENRTVFRTMSTGRIALFTREGNMHQIRVKDVPMGKPKDKGIPIDNICNYNSREENIVSLLPLGEDEGAGLVFITANGYGKVVNAAEFMTIKKTIAAGKLADGDSYAAVFMADKKQLVILTDAGTGIRYNLDELPAQKKTALGVKAIKLAGSSRVTGAAAIAPGEKLILAYEGGEVDAGALKNRKREAKPEKLTIVQ